MTDEPARSYASPAMPLPWSQQKVARVAYVGSDSAAASWRSIGAFRTRLSELAWNEGRISMCAFSAEAAADHVPGTGVLWPGDVEFWNNAFLEGLRQNVVALGVSGAGAWGEYAEVRAAGEMIQ